MTIEDLKAIWNSTIIRIDKKVFYSTELDGDLATYKIKEKILTIKLLNDDFYSIEKSFVKYMMDTIRMNIIVNALEYENDLKEFHVVYEGEILNKAAI